MKYLLFVGFVAIVSAIGSSYILGYWQIGMIFGGLSALVYAGLVELTGGR